MAEATMMERPMEPKKRKPAPTAATVKKKETFSYNDPGAQAVLLVGDFTNWSEDAVPMKRGKDGSWKASISLPAGEYQYRFIVDGEWRNDPDCQERRANGFGEENCIRRISE